MCAKVGVSEVITVLFVGRRILLHQSDGGNAVRLRVIRNGLSRGPRCDPRPTCGEGVLLRHDKDSCLSDRLLVYTTVVTMCSIAAQ